jgi:hypothetical protein
MHICKSFSIVRYGTGYDLASRRKNATRESTATLKAWLNEHKKNPYPTKGEKIMLAIITKMTLTQVSTSWTVKIVTRSIMISRLLQHKVIMQISRF